VKAKKSQDPRRFKLIFGHTSELYPTYSQPLLQSRSHLFYSLFTLTNTSHKNRTN